MEKKNVYSTDANTVIFNSGVLCFISAFFCIGKTFDEYDFFVCMKFAFFFLFILYFLLCAGLKRMTFTDEGVEFCYFLRPFWRVYKYKYEDVKKMYYERGFSAGSFPMFYFKVIRNHKIGPFQKKFVFFLNKYKDAREIVMRFREYDIPFKFPECDYKRYLIGEKEKWGDLSK